MAKEGAIGLLGRGLAPKLVSNGVQGALFVVAWKAIEDKFNNTTGA